MIVNSIDPMGVAVSTPPPPRFRTCRPAPRPRSSSAKTSMFWVDRPSRSSVVMTRVSPSISASSARSNRGVRLAPRIHRDPRRGHRVGRGRPGGPPAAGRWTAAASKRERSRSVSSGTAPMCLLTNGEYADSTRRLRDTVTGIAGCGRTCTIPQNQSIAAAAVAGSTRRLVSQGIRDIGMRSCPRFVAGASLPCDPNRRSVAFVHLVRLAWLCAGNSRRRGAGGNGEGEGCCEPECRPGVNFPAGEASCGKPAYGVVSGCAHRKGEHPK